MSLNEKFLLPGLFQQLVSQLRSSNLLSRVLVCGSILESTPDPLAIKKLLGKNKLTLPHDKCVLDCS